MGDEVVSRNSVTGKLESEPVTALTPLHKDSLLEIRIEGEHDPLRPSTRHPFWVKRGEAQAAWIESGSMRVGDQLQTLQGNWRRVVAITPLPGQETVYNFTVDQNHDYFVGETGFLVHNAGDCNCGPRNVIGRVKDLQNLPPGEQSLLDRLPNLGNPQANWKQNYGVLRQVMGLGLPIGDKSPGDTGGQFLNAERYTLQDRGWTFDEETNLWCPPE